MSLPKVLQFKNIKPRGFATRQKRWIVNPQASYNTFAQNEMIRFVLNTDGFIDPYNCYCQIEVTTSDALLGPNGGTLMLDGASTSLIQELTLYSDSKIIERILEYDQLGQVLSDLSYDPLVKAYKQYEGWGFEGIHKNNTNLFKFQPTAGIQGGSIDIQNYGTSQPPDPTAIATSHDEKLCYLLVQSGNNATVTNPDTTGNSYGRNRSEDYQVAISGSTSAFTIKHYRNTDKILKKSLAGQTFSKCGYLPQASIPLLISDVSGNALTSTQQLALNSIDIKYGQNAFLNNFDTAYVGLDGEFGIEGELSKVQGIQDLTNKTCAEAGYFVPYSNALSGNKSQYLSTRGTALKIVNGKFQTLSSSLQPQTSDVNNSVNITKQTFIVPILSGVLGILIPPEQWRLLPGKAFNQLMFEWRLSPYAFFTNGYSGSFIPANLVQRNWKITNFQMIFHIWYFDEIVTSQIDQALGGEGIILSSQSWSMGPIYQILANGSVTNNWQINNGIESVKALFFWFIPNDYMKYPFCRKHFRLSMNLQYIQLKVGGEYIPPNPIEGHAGNIAKNNFIKDDNTNFVIELHDTTGKLFSKENTMLINKTNFAVNDRPYNPGEANYYNAFSSTFWQELRCQGRALYAINLDSNPDDQDVLSGLDTTKLRPIELIIKGSDLDKFQRDSTMFTMLNHDFYVQLNAQGCRTFGQG